MANSTNNPPELNPLTAPSVDDGASRSVSLVDTGFPAMQLVRTTRKVRFFGWLTLIALVLSIAAMLFVPWRQTAKGTGMVLALDPQERPQQVLSPAVGVVSWVAEGLREGSYVEQGQPLIKMTPFAADGVLQLDSQVSAVEAKLSLAGTAIANAEQNAAEQKLSGERMVQSLNQELAASRKKWDQAKNEIDVFRAELKDKENQLRIADEIREKELISEQKYFSIQQEVAASLNKLLKAENRVDELFATLNAKEEEIEAKKQEIFIKNRLAEQKVLSETTSMQSITKELSELQNKRDEFNRLEVTAPRSGYIQTWYGIEGSDTVKAGEPLFTIVPDATQLAVEMKVSGNDMPLIHEGDVVRLQFEGWPAVQFVGWPSVAVGTFGGKVNRVFPTDDGKGNFRVVVTPDVQKEGENAWPDDRYLRQGVRANGWVLLKRVPLGYEIWRQLNGFPPVVADEAPAAGNDKKGSKVPLPKA